MDHSGLGPSGGAPAVAPLFTFTKSIQRLQEQGPVGVFEMFLAHDLLIKFDLI